MPSPQRTLLCSYRYDPLDRLISHTQSHMQTRQRFYCKSRLVTEIQGATQHSVVQHDDQLLAQQQRQDQALATTLLVTDQQRSVLHTLKPNNQRQPIAYSPYGHCPAFSGLLSLLGFNGEQPDPVTGCYLLGNGYRAFNPALMRFNSPDSLSPFGEGGLNSYAYCLGDPINLSDSLGHAPLGQAFKSLAPGHITRSILKSVQKEISKTPRSPHPKARLKSELNIHKNIVENTRNLLFEGSALERIGIASGDIKPLTLPATPESSTERYFQHQATGIPFNKSGIPNPKVPLTTTNGENQEILRTDFFDDTIGFFHHQTIKDGPELYKEIMRESAGATILKRAKYIRKHALRNY